MSALTVFLTIIGICLIIISFIFFDKDESPTKGIVKLNDYELDDEEMSKLQDSIRTSVRDYSERLVDETDTEMVNSANKRMLEINELAEQVLGDIEKSRKELSFLYDMIEDKSGSLKAYVSTSAERLFAMQQDVMRVVPDEDKDKIAKVIATDTKENQIKEDIERMVKSQEEAMVPSFDTEGNEESRLRNEKILAMYDGGEDTIAIAKELNMGVGEVQLVIDLNRGENNEI
ncbi:MAG: hypothetical protein II699_06210 [Lachnospiraceae bacterium]|nr:hypothetical protein [Lachnospiraceae bacterium]